MPKGRIIASTLTLLCTLLGINPSRADPPPVDAGVVRPSATRRQIAEVLHHTSALSRLRMRCRSVDAPKPEQKPLQLLHCTFSTLSIRQQPPERMATLENYVEILRDLRAQCRSARPRSEPARMACAECRKDLSDACLYQQAMMALRKDCAKPSRPAAHPNPAVAALLRAEAERGTGGAQVMQRFCAACAHDPSAECFSAFWRTIHAPARCALATDVYELELARQGATSTWAGNLGGPCHTQISLVFDERRKEWTYTEVRLTPDQCTQDRALPDATKPVVYSSAAHYAFSDLPATCEHVSLL